MKVISVKIIVWRRVCCIGIRNMEKSHSTAVVQYESNNATYVFLPYDWSTAPSVALNFKTVSCDIGFCPSTKKFSSSNDLEKIEQIHCADVGLC